LTLAAVQFCHILDFMVIMPLGPILVAELSIAPGEFGLLVSAYTISAACFGLLTATIVDRFERKRLALAIFLSFAVATLACAFAPTFAWLLAARCAAGAFGGVLTGLVYSMLGDMIPQQRRGHAIGVVQSGFAAASVAGVPLALFVANHWGWRSAFIVTASVTAIVFASAALALPTLRGHLASRPGGHLLSAIAAALRDANHLNALIFIALVVFSSLLIVPYIAVYLVANVGVAQSHLPLIYLVGGTTMLISARHIGRFADTHGRVWTYRVIGLFSMVPILLLTNAGPSPLWVVVLITTIYFVFVPGRMVAAMAIISSAATPAARGTFLVISGAVQQVVSGVAAYVGGVIVATDSAGRLTHYDKSGLLAVMVTALAIALAGRIRHTSVDP